jgi:hypothetical protein
LALWQAGTQAAAVVVSCAEHHTAQLSLDGLLRAARVTHCRSLADTQRAVRARPFSPALQLNSRTHAP